MDSLKFSFHSSVVFCLILLSITACGIKIPNLSSQVNPKSTSLLGNLIPPYTADIYSVAVNNADLGRASVSGNHFAQIISAGGPSAVGAFYGSGVGNKALIGIGGDSFAGKNAGLFSSIQFKTLELVSNASGAYNVYLNILVDLNCNISNPSYVIVVVDEYAVTSTPKGNWNSYVINATDSVFKSVGAKGGLPSNNGTTGLPFTTLTTAYPLACFVAADTHDNGMKRAQVVSPFLLIHGDSAYTQISSVEVDDIQLTVGGNTISFSFE